MGRAFIPGNGQPVLNKEGPPGKVMPDVKGMGLKDALYLLGEYEYKSGAERKGKSKGQSISPGVALQKMRTVFIQLD